MPDRTPPDLPVDPGTPDPHPPDPAAAPRILVADDDAIGRRLVSAQLGKRGYEVVTAVDGGEAWRALTGPDAPRVAILDWMMPEMDGMELVRRLRERSDEAGTYVIMLTSRDDRHDLLKALSTGADDYVTKPFDGAELEARVRVGLRVVGLQARLERRVEELERTLARVRELQSLLPICSYCSQVRDDQDYWQSLEDYLARQSEVRFSHGICPSCMEEHWSDLTPEEEGAAGP